MQTDNLVHAQICNVIKQLIVQLSAVKNENIVIERMTGITNETYKFYEKQSKKAYIYRKFGSSTQNIFLDRDSQQYVYQHISQAGLGPKIIAYLQGVRIQQFIQSSVLQTNQMLELDYYKKVAFTFQKFHGLKPQKLQKKSLIQDIFLPKEPKILRICHEKMNRSIYTEQQKEILMKLRKWICIQQLQFLREAVKSLQSQELVFSHNDALANNILLKKDTNQAILIDYQYSRFNYSIFDIANYFNQTQYNYDEPNPPYFTVIPKTQQKQKNKKDFIKCYCLAKDKNYEEYLKCIEADQISEELQQQINKLEKQLILGTMLSNLVWGWWAVIVCKNPAINFDYLKFAEKRVDDYLDAKNTGKWKLQ